jgi:hypothetical protein
MQIALSAGGVSEPGELRDDPHDVRRAARGVAPVVALSRAVDLISGLR